MNNAIIRYVFDRKKQADNSMKTGLLQIEIRQKGTNKCVYISTGVHLYKNQYSDTNGFVDKPKDNPTTKTLGKIKAAYPELNINWLKTGERNMIKSIVNNASNSTYNESNLLQGTNISYNNVPSDVIAENSTNYQEIIKTGQGIIKTGQEQVAKLQEMFIKQQEQMSKLIEMLEQSNNK
jgi:hypothetical protein